MSVVGGRSGGNDRHRLPTCSPTPFASSEVEMPLGRSATSMDVSTSLDTNGQRGASALPPFPTIHCRFGKNDGIRPEVDILLNRHPGLDPGSTTSTPQWIPDQVRDDEGLKTTDSRREKTFHVAVSSHCFALPATPFFQNEIEIAPVSYGGSNASFCECSASND